MFYTYAYRSGFIHETDGKPTRVQARTPGGINVVLPASSTAHAKRLIRRLESGSPVVRLTYMRREVAVSRRGRVSYEWRPGYLVNGTYPPVSLREAYQTAREIHADPIVIIEG